MNSVGIRGSGSGNSYDGCAQKGNGSNRTRVEDEEEGEIEEDEEKEEEGYEDVYSGSSGSNVPSGQTVGGVWMPKIGTKRTYYTFRTCCMY